MLDEIYGGVVGSVGGGSGGGGDVFGRRIEVRNEIFEGERSEMATVEGIGIEVEDGFSDGGCGGGDDGFGKAGADDNKIEVDWVYWRVGGGF